MLIEHVRFTDIPKLSRLFQSALSTDFLYYPPEHTRLIRRQNSMARMALAYLRPRRLLIVAKDGRRVVGYSIASADDPRRAQIYWFYIMPDYRGRRLGKSLLDYTHRALSRAGAQKIQLVTHDFAGYYRRQGYNLTMAYQSQGARLSLMELDLTKL